MAALAQIGPLTSATEALATAVGAAMILGAFLSGAVGTVRGWPRPALEENALNWGYFGGIVGTILVLVDLAALWLLK